MIKFEKNKTVFPNNTFIEKQANDLYAINFLKFALLFPILIFHLFDDFGFKILKLKTTFEGFITARNGYVAADMFFIISGYFLYKSIQNHPQDTVLDFAIRRLKRLMPILLFSFLVILIFNLKYENISLINTYNIFYQSLLLQTTGIATKGDLLNPYAWYIATLFWGSIFYFLIMQCFSKLETRQLIFLIFIFTGLTCIHNYNGSGAFHREIFLTFFSSGMIKSFTCLGLGCLISSFNIKKPTDSLKNKLIYSCLEVFLYFQLFYNLIFHYSNKYDNIYLLILFNLLFIISLLNCGIISNFLNKIKFKNKYGYSIYVNQWITYLLLSKFDFFNTNILSNNPKIIYLSIIFALIIGIISQKIINLLITPNNTKNILSIFLILKHKRKIL